MRIAMIGPFGLCSKGTMAVRALPMAQALCARGHSVRIVLPPWDCPAEAGQERELGGVHVINVRLPPNIPLLRHLWLTWRLVRTAIAGGVDVVHCFKPKAYSGLAALLIGFGQRLHLIRTRLIVDTDDWEGPGGWNEIGGYSRLQRRLFAWQERWGLTHCDAVTVASRALQTLVWATGVPPKQVYYVPNGVVPAGQGIRRHPGASSGPSLPEDGSRELRKRYGLDDRRVLLLYTRLFEFDVGRLVDILEGVVQHLPATSLLVVGQGLFGEEEGLQTAARARGLGSHLVYAGWVEPEELPAHFALADLALYPFDDTLINRAKCAVKLIDLLAAGVPVVADRVGQNAEYIEHNVSGILVEPGDTMAWVEAVTHLLNDDALRRRIGEAAQQRVNALFSWERLVAGVEAAYRGC